MDGVAEEKMLHGGVFTHKSWYAKKLLHTGTVTQKMIHAEKLLHTHAFTQNSVYAEKSLPEKIWHGKKSTQSISKQFLDKNVFTMIFFYLYI